MNTSKYENGNFFKKNDQKIKEKMTKLTFK